MTTEDAPSEEPSATEGGWAANRRAFVADARDEAADEREHIADARDTAADERDRAADDRERLLDERDRELDNRARDSGLAVPGRDPAKRARRIAADARRAEARVRGEAATARSHAGRARAGAAARRGPGDRLLAREFAQLAVTLYGAESFEKVLARLVEVAADAVPGCDQASITLVEAGGPRTPAASGEAAEALDELQYRFGEGPCLDALDAVMVTATGDEWRRWPRLQAAKPKGVETVVSCGLLLPAGGPTGSLNLYGSAPDAIDAESRQIALVLAAHAAIAVATARERQGAVDLEQGLREALASRDVIGQAKGILMGRQGISADDAFDVLRRASQRLNVKLRDLARDLSEGIALTAATDTAIEAGTLAGAVGELLDRADDFAPDQLPDLGRVVGATTGVRSTRMWLADYEQRRLVPFGQPPEIDGFDIDGTVGGQAFRLAEPRELAQDDGVLLWVPLVDGTERLGVVQFELDRLDAYRRGTLLTICGAKHAIQGFTESVRSELLHDGSGIWITQVHLPGMNTPQFRWCRTHLPKRAQPVPPILQPEAAAEAIVWAADARRREVLLDTPTVKTVLGAHLAPWRMTRIVADRAYESQMTDEPVPEGRADNLFESLPGDAGAHGAFDHVAGDGPVLPWYRRGDPVAWGAAALTAAIGFSARLVAPGRRRREGVTAPDGLRRSGHEVQSG